MGGRKYGISPRYSLSQWSKCYGLTRRSQLSLEQIERFFQYVAIAWYVHASCVVCTLNDNGKLVYQINIATLLPIVVKILNESWIITITYFQVTMFERFYQNSGECSLWKKTPSFYLGLTKFMLILTRSFPYLFTLPLYYTSCQKTYNCITDNEEKCARSQEISCFPKDLYSVFSNMGIAKVDME